mgnify:CR=1 FL=1
MSHKPSASTGRVLMIWAVILGLSTLACSSLVNQTIDKTVETTANTVGEKVGKKVGDAVAGAILTKLDPALMHLYTSSIATSKGSSPAGKGRTSSRATPSSACCCVVEMMAPSGGASSRTALAMMARRSRS